MAQHYQRNVCRVSKWCPTCGRMTMHRVDDKRVGCCLENHVAGMTKKQEQKAKAKKDYDQESLF